MGNSQALQIKQQMSDSGYAIIRGVFDDAEMQIVREEFDRIRAIALQYKGIWRDQNVVYVVHEHPEGGFHVRFVHWVPYISPLLDEIRVDHRYLDILRPLLGSDIRQIQSQTTWKTPGCSNTYYSFHQDARFRKPASAYRNIGTSNLNMLLAVDPHTLENGCLQVYPGSHTMGTLDLPQHDSILKMGYQHSMLTDIGLDPQKLVPMELQPGDIAIWYAYVVHGSGPNISGVDRRAFINSYSKAEDTDRGEWAFKDGEPCRLEGPPALINYNDLYTNDQPHYIEGALYPERDES